MGGSLLAYLVSGAESSYGANVAGQPASMVNPLYGQYSGFTSTYGNGVAGINNYATQLLAANPNATLDDFYGEYFGGTGTPGALGASGYSLWPQGASAQSNWANILASNGLSPNTPLSSVIGLNTGQTPSSATSVATSGGIGSDAVAGGLFGTNTNTIGPTGLGVSTIVSPGNETSPDFGDLSDDTFDSDAATGATSPLSPAGMTGISSTGQVGTQGSVGSIGSGQPVNITDLPQLDTSVKGAGTSIQSGAQNAATGIAGTIASTVNSIESYTSSAFVIAALVVVGVIMLAYGLGMFKHIHTPTIMPIPV